MIATILRGGLGNQMFMYAMAKAMALRNNTEPIFNINSGFAEDYTFKRKLELGCLNVNLQQNARLTFNVPLSHFSLCASRKLKRNIFAPSYKFIMEDSTLHFQEELTNTHSTKVFLEGYWQSEKYFSDYKDIIRNDFQITMPIAGYIMDELHNIHQNCDNLVLLGVRRYQECASVKDGYLLSEDYYNKAIEIIESKVENPKFVVFSQDMVWAKEHLDTKKQMYFVKQKNGEYNSIEDLFLMTNCRHAIISNSSFYWWGAWLSNYGDGIVIAPNNFANRDSVCDNWIKLD